MTPHFLGDDARRIGDAALGVDADLGRDAVPGPRLQARAQPLHDVCMLRGPVKRKHTKARHPPLFERNISKLQSLGFQRFETANHDNEEERVRQWHRRLSHQSGSKISSCAGYQL